jgi:beta-lactamase class A
MIRNSSNEAATTVFRRVGPERVAEILQAEPWRLYDPDHGGGLWVGRDYGGEVWRRDPVAGQSHGASAMQVARFYYLLATRQLVSEASTDAMLEILSKPAIRHKFVIGLAEENPDARLYRKSGTWKQFHADSALVVDPGYQYIVVALVEDEDGAAILEKFVSIADRVVAGSHQR